MVVLAATLIAALPGAAVPARAATVGAAATDPPAVTLQFGGMDPGTTEVRTAALTIDAPEDAALVRAVVSATGGLVDHLTTRVEACSVPWGALGCSAGGAVLLDGPVAPGLDESLDIPVPASGVAYIRVGLTLDGAAPANAASTVTYRLDLVAPDPAVAPTPPGPGEPAPPAPGTTVPLATTGADAAALAAAALALVALGLTLRTWVRERRGVRARGWAP
ncbi:hypothetical protein ASD16_02375 [Cellulomonas sp. Root485]|nr:hypothetical protein ASD16_02375 [Cellulomonas sp. Root485]